MPKTRKCRVRECNSPSNVRFFAFPKEPALQEKWRDNLFIPREVHLAPTNAFVCERHFEEGAKSARFLKPGAIPTLNLGGNDDVQHELVHFKLKKSCCVKSCVSDVKQILYAFPREENLRKEWALACKVEVSTDKLYVCQRHFEQEYVRKNRLLPGGFPCLRLEEDLRIPSPSDGSVWECQPVTKCYEVMKVEDRSDDSIDDLTLEEFEKYSDLAVREKLYSQNKIQENLDKKTRRERVAQATRAYIRKDRTQQCKIDMLNRKIRELKVENQDLRRRAIIADKNSSKDALMFAKMIVNKNKRASYTDDEKVLSQNINFMSTKSYSFMRDDLGFALPSKTSLLRWRPIRYVAPGFDVNVCKNLTKIAKNMTDIERMCVLLFDEIVIKSDLTYNKANDLIDGFQDIGGGKRELKLGDKCCFFMIKGLASNWKYVFSYYITKGAIPVTQLKPLVLDNISKLKEIGLNVKAIICDQGPANSSMYDRFCICERKPYFKHEGQKVYCLFDYCHLFKSIRNTFLTNYIETDDGIVSFDVIKALYEIDKDNPLFKICPKLTEVHVYPSNFERMNVSRAVQTLSNSVAAGIELASTQNLFAGKYSYAAKYAKPTKDFVKKFNDLFDDLDAKTLNSKNPFKCPLSRDSTEKIQRLKDYISFLQSFKVFRLKDGLRQYRDSQIQCIRGMCVTISAMLMMSEELFDQQKDLSFILLGKLNQDALENFFYRIRASQGINTNPTAHEIQYIVARLTSMKILRQRFIKKGNNCEDDTDESADWVLTPEESRLENQENEALNVAPNEMAENIESSKLALVDFDVPDENVINAKDKAEVQVQRYYTGYGIYQKVLRKLRCERCTALMTKTHLDHTNYSEALVKAKNYKDSSDLRLVNPDDGVFEVCRMQMKWYSQLIPVHAHRANLKTFLLSIIRSKTEEVFPEWFSQENPCFNHRVTLLDFLITVLLFKNAKWMLRETVVNRRELTKQKNLKKNKKQATDIAGQGPSK